MEYQLSNRQRSAKPIRQGKTLFHATSAAGQPDKSKVHKC